MKRVYEDPTMKIEKFVANNAIAGCDLNIVSGTDTVKIYCAKTSYVTVFTSSIGCSVIHAPFTSTAAATSYFSQLFQWGDAIAEGGNVTNNTTSLGWSDAQRATANAEINNGQTTLLDGTIDLGGYGSATTFSGGGHGGPGGPGEGGSKVHAGYALDFLNGFEEGKALS